jgi:NADH-quinone oxidoreductase subunit J
MVRVDPASVAFFGLAAVTLGSASVAALARDATRAAVALVPTLAGVAGLYVMLASPLLAAAQVVLFVGGASLTAIAAAALLARRAESPPTSRRRAALATVTLGLALAIVAGRTSWPLRASAAPPASGVFARAVLAEHGIALMLAGLVLGTAVACAFAIVCRQDEPESP